MSLARTKSKNKRAQNKNHMERNQKTESPAFLGSNYRSIWCDFLLPSACWLGNGISELQTETRNPAFRVCRIRKIPDTVLRYDVYPCYPEYSGNGSYQSCCNFRNGNCVCNFIK